MISIIFSVFIFVTSFLVILSFLVFFHELGHYSIARFFGVSVERFSIGFGRPLTSWKAKSGTEWSIGRFPLGGYVKFLGDAGAASNPDRTHLESIRENLETQHGQDAVESCFHFKPLWQRTLIVAAGPIANFILAILVFASVALIYGETDVKSVVVEVVPGTAAEEAGVQAGDIFLTLDGIDVRERTAFVTYVSVRSGKEMTARVQRGDDIVTFPITPRRQERRDAIGGKMAIGTAGVRIDSRDEIVTRTHNPISALGYGTEQFGSTLSTTGTYIKRMFQGREDGKQLGGPTRIATMTGKTAVDGIEFGPLH